MCPQIAFWKSAYDLSEWPAQVTRGNLKKLGVELRDKLLKSPTVQISFTLDADLMQVTIPDECLSRQAPLGITDDDLSPEKNWAHVAFRLAQAIADALLQEWRAIGRSLDELDFDFEPCDDGPRQTYYTFYLRIDVRREFSKLETRHAPIA